jgi:hypothetical protein
LDNVRIIDGKKFMWDGEDYESESVAKENASKYSKDGFETKLMNEGEKYIVYTRRVVTEVVVEGEPI